MKATLAIGATAALGFLLGGCTLFAPQPEEPSVSDAQMRASWQQHRQKLIQVRAFTVDGRAANSLGIRADLHWQQFRDGRYEARIAGPLGMGATEISGDQRRVQVRSAQGVEVSDNPEAWMAERVGWTLPLRGLRWWALGLPAPGVPAQIELDAQGQLSTLSQSGWTLSYLEYAEVDGLSLPRRLEASNDEVRVKLLFDRWQDVLQSAPRQGY